MVRILVGCVIAMTSLGVRSARGDDREAIDKFVKSFSEPIRIKASKPVTVNDAQFVLVAQTNWKPAKPDKSLTDASGFPMVAPIDIQLHISNQSKRDLLFPTFGTFGIRIVNADGKEVKLRTEGKGDNATRPVILPEGASYALCRQAELRYDENAKGAELLFYDGTGVKSLTGPLKPGQYKLVCWYAVAPDKQEKRKDGAPPMWVGDVTTNEVPIQVLDEFTKGGLTGEQRLRPFTEPVRIRESKPVRVNDAQFVVAAQAEWTGGRSRRDIPIDVQLRITNLSKNDLVFPKFDTVGVRLTDADGNQIGSGAGRDHTSFPRPVLLSAGVSYSLGTEGAARDIGRRTVLDWNENRKASELVYWDETGSWSIFGPLQPGRYKLAFWYAVSPRGPLKTERDSGTWLGKAVTENVTIEVLER
jgi:hypothetical protein